MICDEPWDYDAVRHVGCCPSCGGALRYVGADVTPATTTVAAPEPTVTGRRQWLTAAAANSETSRSS
jgi:transposase